MKIVYCIAGTCHSGGMERVLANKANYLASKGYDVVIVTTDQKNMPPFFPLDPRIRCIDLDINYEDNNGKSFINKLAHYPVKQFKHRKRLRDILLLERPDITVSMFNNDASFIPNIKDGSAKLLEIHFSKFKRLQYGRKGLWKIADLWRSRQDERVVRRYDKFVVLTDEDKTYWGKMPNIEVIPNALNYSTASVSSLESKKVLAVGRYNFQKGFDLLIESWRLIAGEFPDWKLDIVGDGEERLELEKLIKQYGLSGSVSLVKTQKDMEYVYTNASIYALTSRYEGLPMVLLEAQSFGLPIVSFKCKCGPMDIVDEGRSGFLVEEGNISEFAVKLGKLMGNTRLRKEMGKNAKNASSKYNEEIIMGKWINIFKILTDK